MQGQVEYVNTLAEQSYRLGLGGATLSMYDQRSERELRPTSHTPRIAQSENRTRYDWDRITTLYSNLTQAAELETRATEPSFP